MAVERKIHVSFLQSTRRHTSRTVEKRMFPGYHENFPNYAESRLKTNLTAIKKVVTSRPAVTFTPRPSLLPASSSIPYRKIYPPRRILYSRNLDFSFDAWRKGRTRKGGRRKQASLCTFPPLFFLSFTGSRYLRRKRFLIQPRIRATPLACTDGYLRGVKIRNATLEN